MKILCVIDSLGSGGAQRQMVNLAAKLRQRGEDVGLCYYYQDDFYRPQLEQAGITPVLLSAKNPADRILRVRRYIRQSGADVVLSFLNTPNLLTCVAAATSPGRRWGLVISERSGSEKSFHGPKMRVYKWFARFADRIVCNAYSARDLWTRMRPRYTERLRVVYNIIEAKAPADVPAREADGRRRVVVAARYEPVKNAEGLVEAVRLLDDTERARLCVDWYGLIRPERNTHAAAQALVDAYGLADCVRLHGRTDQIYREMAGADLVGLFSFVEGLPNVIAEGMMLGRPAIMTRVGEARYLVDDSCAFLCDADSPESIRDALRAALAVPDAQLSAMGEAARARAHSLFDAQSARDAWLSVFAQAIAARRP